MASLSLEPSQGATNAPNAVQVSIKDFQETHMDVVAELLKQSDMVRRDLSDIILEFCSQNETTDADGIAKALAEKSDLLSGVYEGGVKTWECSLDLLGLLKDTDLTNSTVLEIGCGSALPGIYCLKAGASKVDFSDYNANVLKLVTIPNVLLNLAPTPQPQEDGTFETSLDLKDMDANGKARYFAGDWSTLAPLLSKRYSLLLTSETIYNKDYHHRLLDLIEATLDKHGKCYVAAKHTYFGCSGDLFSFLALLTSRDKMTSKTIKVYADEGVRREIVELSWKQ